MEKNDLSPKQSLVLISEMIERGRRDYEKNIGSTMVFWGSVAFLCSLVVWLLIRQTMNANWNILWFAIPVVSYPIQKYLFKNKVENVKSFISEIIKGIWISYGTVSVAITIITCFWVPQLAPFCGAMVLMTLGLAGAVIGFVVKNYCIVTGCLLASIIGPTLWVVIESVNKIFVMSGVALVTLIIPGLLINIKRK